MQSLLIKLGAGLLALVLFAWLGAPHLKPLSKLLPNTRAMVTVTGEILKETEALQAGVGEVQANLAKVKRQDELLAQQYDLMQRAVTELKRQEELAGRSGRLLVTTLEKERTTADLTARASQAAAGTMAAVNSNAAEVNRLATAATRVQAGSANIDRQLNGMLGELQRSKTNFAVLGRLEEAIRRALYFWR